MDKDIAISRVEVTLHFNTGRTDTVTLIPTPDNEKAIKSILDGVADFKLRWLGLPSQLED